MPVQECRAKTTATEFLQWNAFLDEEDNKHTWDQWYMAQIAKEVRAVSTLKFNPIGMFMHRIPSMKEKKIDKTTRLSMSKRFWFVGVGIDPKRKKK